MSQFRKDPISGEWVIIAPERAKRLLRSVKIKMDASRDSGKCPFCDLEGTGNWPPVVEYAEKGKWQAVVIPNKFPALHHGDRCPSATGSGPYALVEGLGHHELVVTRNHRKNFPALSGEHALQVFRLFADRYRSIDRDRCMAYLSIFGNWGASAGASQAHPHFQLIALPVIPPDVERSFRGAAEYFRKEKRCGHCDMLAYEQREKRRIIAENEYAVALAPFASKAPYTAIVFPKAHEAFFENASSAIHRGAAELLQYVLRRIKVKLGDPDNNFFIHTGPLADRRKHAHYHWHIEVVPKIGTPAGFELATGMYVNVVDPDMAAKTLR